MHCCLYVPHQPLKPLWHSEPHSKRTCWQPARLAGTTPKQSLNMSGSNFSHVWQAASPALTAVNPFMDAITHHHQLLAETKTDIIALSPMQVSFAAALIVVQAIVSVRLSLGLHTQLLIAAVRCILQLSALGYILVPIFKYGMWWSVCAYALFMMIVSAFEAVGRPQYTYKVMPHCCKQALTAY